MMFFMLFIWLGLLAIAIWAVRALFPTRLPAAATKPHSRALEIAAERYARGEIDHAAYERIRKDLGIAAQDRTVS